MKTSNHELGLQWLFEDYVVIFGDQGFQSEQFSKFFPHFELRSIKQVHGDQVVETTPNLTEADAHYSTDPFLALQIKTADCLPIFICDPVKKNILAIHAGWRGVANQITMKAIQRMVNLGGEPRNFRVVIGPHIRRESFEVHEPVWVELMDSVPVNFNHHFKKFYEPQKEQKYKVDLEGIVRAQMSDLGIIETQVHVFETDTVTNRAWHSYRRDREKSGRNLSFIARFR